MATDLIDEEVVGPSCPWRPEWVGLGIPAFLVISAEERKKAWENFPITRQGTGETEEAWQAKQRFYREAYEGQKKDKNAAALAGLKAKHAGERYDRKTKVWVPDITATVKNDEVEDDGNKSRAR